MVITSSATANSLSGMVRLSALAVVMGIVQVNKTYIGESASDRHWDKRDGGVVETRTTLWAKLISAQAVGQQFKGRRRERAHVGKAVGAASF
jgi:hypothetical protein